MTIDIGGVTEGALVEYARIPIAFEVQTILDIAVDHRHNGFRLSERLVATAYVKDYDTEADGPTQWPARFDTSRWGLMTARIGGRCVGGAAVEYDTPELDILEGRSDLAVLWDIRVLPQNRRQGVGAASFGAARAWALARDCRQLKVETQNVNVAACRFYAQRGCVRLCPTRRSPRCLPRMAGRSPAIVVQGSDPCGGRRLTSRWSRRRGTDAGAPRLIANVSPIEA
jgi:GNAT superfamily N-acetyltransferase